MSSNNETEPFVKSYPFMGPIMMSVIWWLVCLLVALVLKVCFNKSLSAIIRQYFLVVFIMYTWVLVL